MATIGPADRIRAAIADAAKNLARQPDQGVTRDAPAVGDLYVFDVGEDVGLEWLVVRPHPDDAGLVLLAPMDDFPFVGPPDLALPGDLVGRPLTLRCGETDWFPVGFCSPHLRAGTIPERAVSLVRQRLAGLARGRVPATEHESVEFDAEYEEWMNEVARARSALLARAAAQGGTAVDVVPLASLPTNPPASITAAPEFALAAGEGALFAELGEALAGGSDTRYLEVPDVPGGKLILVAGSSGVRGIWEGPIELAPPLSSVIEAGGESPLPWRAGPEGRLQQTERHAPWIDGRAFVAVGTVPRRTLAVQL